MLDKPSNTVSEDMENNTSNITLDKSLAILQVELQGLQFLLAQGIIMGPLPKQVITSEVESLIKRIRHLGTYGGTL